MPATSTYTSIRVASLNSRLIHTTPTSTAPPTPQLNTSNTAYWSPTTTTCSAHRLSQLCNNCASPAARAKTCAVTPGSDTLSPTLKLPQQHPPKDTHKHTSDPPANPVDPPSKSRIQSLFCQIYNHYPDPRHLDYCYNLLVDVASPQSSQNDAFRAQVMTE